MPEEEARATNILAHAKSLPGLREMVIEGVVRRGRMACDEIVNIAKDWQADVIVMSAHSKRTLHQKIFGRTVDQVRRKAPCELVLDEIPSYSAYKGSQNWALFEKYVIDYFSGVIHRGVERGEILAPARYNAGGRPEGQNLGALVAPCG